VLIRTATDACRDAFADKGVRLLVEAGPEAGVVDVDPHRMAQVLANLLGNALRHTPAGGTVTVAGAGTSRDAVLTATDTGEGILAEALPHVFERFYRGEHARDRDSGGAGIGLSIVKALVEAHGGAISARSEGAGRGATFTITLPLDGTPA
jgi:signal transduction histidine kinase